MVFTGVNPSSTGDSDPFGAAPFDPEKIRRHVQKQEALKAQAVVGGVTASQLTKVRQQHQPVSNSLVTVISVNSSDNIISNNTSVVNSSQGNQLNNSHKPQQSNLIWF